MIYVDALFVAVSRQPQARQLGKRTGHQWCHLWADNRAELDAFALRIGLQLRWWQRSPPWMPSGHYDLTPGRREAALRAGVTVTTVARWRTSSVKMAAGQPL